LIVFGSELAEPQKLLNYMLQPAISKLHPDTIAVYIHAATKVFGFWSSELAQRWDDDDLPRVRDTVDFVVERLHEYVTSPDIEVQERASTHILFHIKIFELFF
jgi:AP-3 complex subunit delta-1